MKPCPICHQEMDDTRHVNVECFYAVHEVVPDAEKIPFFQEVDQDKTYLGITRHYENGTRDEWYNDEEKAKLHNANHAMDIRQTPINNSIRLLENTMYSITCCKSCRGDFLRLLKDWRNGEFIQSPGSGNIPVRINGAVKMLTEDEFADYQKSKGNI